MNLDNDRMQNKNYRTQNTNRIKAIIYILKFTKKLINQIKFLHKNILEWEQLLL